MEDKKIFELLFKKTGIKLQVHDERFYKRVLTEGSLGLGESYMDGWWDCQKLDELFNKLLSFEIEKNAKKSLPVLFGILMSKIFNMQSKGRAFNIGKKHYDIGNDLFKSMLDKRMVYTCGYWKEAKNLNQAQEAKLDLVCQKLKLKPGQKVLDIGCGWGSFAKYAAEKYKVNVIGITVSKEQVELGNKLCKGLPVEIRLQDYRDVNEKFDHIVSLGMIEHVGRKNYRTYMEVANRCLKDDGLFLLHTIGTNESGRTSDHWMNKHIFPGGILPSIKELGGSIEGLFIMEDWHNLSTDYDKTLMAWYKNFDKNWDKLKSNYDERFYRMWKYYLLSCAGGFRARKIQLWQIVLSKNGVPAGYQSIR
ncbi:cyclopropane fatty acyl phospholipid synthase [Patescibacteria group bacterium]|nr:cyclopropane fatty acyl phospholipid synthase [Patescibacteria group bacterium]